MSRHTFTTVHSPCPTGQGPSMCCLNAGLHIQRTTAWSSAGHSFHSPWGNPKRAVVSPPKEVVWLLFQRERKPTHKAEANLPKKGKLRKKIVRQTSASSWERVFLRVQSFSISITTSLYNFLYQSYHCSAFTFFILFHMGSVSWLFPTAVLL